MNKDNIPGPRGGIPFTNVRPGDTIIFKYEGNVRATVEAYEVVNDQVWLDAQTSIEFKIPLSQVLWVEKE